MPRPVCDGRDVALGLDNNIIPCSDDPNKRFFLLEQNPGRQRACLGGAARRREACRDVSLARRALCFRTLAPTRLGRAGLAPYQAHLLCRRFTVAYHSRGYSEPVILLTDMVVENRDLALQVRNRYARRWAGCETSVEF